MRYTTKVTLQALVLCTTPLFASQHGEISPDQVYPLLQNIYNLHAEHMEFLQTFEDQLQNGHLPDDRTPILFYGPSGTGKTLTLKALINGSNYPYTIISAGVFFEDGLTNLSKCIKKRFLELPKKNETFQRIVFYIDDLHILFDERIVSQLERENALTELALQLERFSRLPEYDHIRIIATANERLPYAMRKLFKCIKFDQPDSPTIKKIIQDKAQHLELDVDIALSYHDKIEGWDLKNVISFLNDTSRLIQVTEKTPEEAFELAYQQESHRMLWENGINTGMKYVSKGIESSFWMLINTSMLHSAYSLFNMPISRCSLITAAAFFFFIHP